MAAISPFPNKKDRRLWRIRYTVTLKDRKIRRDKYAKLRQEAESLKLELSLLERATRTRLAEEDQINEWVRREYIGEGEAEEAFTYYGALRAQRDAVEVGSADYGRIYEAYEERSIKHAREGARGGTHRANISRARRIRSWLQENAPNLSELAPADVSRYLDRLRTNGASQKTVYHHLSIFKLFLDEAVLLNMVKTNPARLVTVPQPKTAKPRRILTEAEIQDVLKKSPTYTDLLRGCLPTVVRLGLYAGLRNSEMAWFQWSSIEWDRGVISVQESESEVTGRVKVPKTADFRILDVKKVFMDFLKTERQRQRKQGILGQFILSARGNKPYHPESLQDAFQKMIVGEEMRQDITLYALRHTYATMLLRSGVDIRTVQHRMGHADIRTTMEYLKYVEPDDHPTDKLPY